MTKNMELVYPNETNTLNIFLNRIIFEKIKTKNQKTQVFIKSIEV
jgi:hypothetical protein